MFTLCLKHLINCVYLGLLVFTYFTTVYSCCLPSFSTVYLYLFTNVDPCLLVFRKMYTCLPITSVYWSFLCLLVFTCLHCLLVHVYLRLPIFTSAYLCLNLFTYVYPCLRMFTSVYLFATVYSCVPTFTLVYLCSPLFVMFTDVNLCLPVFSCLPMFTTVYSCMFTYIYQ